MMPSCHVRPRFKERWVQQSGTLEEAESFCITCENPLDFLHKTVVLIRDLSLVSINVKCNSELCDGTDYSPAAGRIRTIFFQKIHAPIKIKLLTSEYQTAVIDWHFLSPYKHNLQIKTLAVTL